MTSGSEETNFGESLGFVFLIFPGLNSLRSQQLKKQERKKKNKTKGVG
jgi:hypothetical protein